MLSSRQRFFKRLFDVCLSLLTIPILLPVFFIIGIAIKLDDKGPIFFKQKRVGHAGRVFELLKFRTMKVDSGELKSSVTVEGDIRITRVGRFLRQFKIDELPQIINVLKGDMSLVGPRPDVPGYADLLQGDDRIVLSVLPGITGPAQLIFRNEEEVLARAHDPVEYNRKVIWPQKVRLNKEYIRHYSFKKDLIYIWRTIVDR